MRRTNQPPWVRAAGLSAAPEADPDAPLLTWRRRRRAAAVPDDGTTTTDTDLVAPASVERGARDLVRVGQSYQRAFAVLALPRQLRPGALAAIVRLPGVRSTLVNHPVPRHHAKERLAEQIRAMGAALVQSGDDPADETLALRDLRRQLAALAEERTAHHRIGLYLSVAGADSAELDARTRALRDACADAQLRVVACDYQHWEGALTTAPLGHDQLQYLLETDTPTVARLLPSSPGALRQGQGVPILYGVRAEQPGGDDGLGVPVLLDRFALSSPHQAVIAATGGGKSYWQSLMLLQRFAHGACAIAVLDPKGQEYRPLIQQALGGTYLVFSPQAPTRFNPLALPLVDAAAAARMRELNLDLPMERAVLVRQLAVDEARARGRPLTADAEARLEEAIGGCYARRGITSDPATFHADVPTLGDVAAALAEAGADATLRDTLSLFVRGALGRMIGGPGSLPLTIPPSTLRPDVGVLGIDLSAFVQGNDATLQRVLPPLITNYVLTLALCGGGRPMELVIDEAWSLLATPAGRHMLSVIVRVGRSFKVAATVITQQVGDFAAPDADTPCGAGHDRGTFLDNCETVLLLRQLRGGPDGGGADDPIAAAAARFTLGPGERRWLARCRRDDVAGATGLLRVGREPIRLRVPRAPDELHALITDPAGLARRTREGGNAPGHA